MNIPLIIASTTTQINWTIFFAQLPSILFIVAMFLVLFGISYMMVFMICDTCDCFYNDTKTSIFFKVTAIILAIYLSIFGIYKWITWSNETLSKEENKNKPIIEHIQER